MTAYRTLEVKQNFSQRIGLRHAFSNRVKLFFGPFLLIQSTRAKVLRRVRNHALFHQMDRRHRLTVLASDTR